MRFWYLSHSRSNYGVGEPAQVRIVCLQCVRFMHTRSLNVDVEPGQIVLSLAHDYLCSNLVGTIVRFEEGHVVTKKGTHTSTGQLRISAKSDSCACLLKENDPVV